LDRDVSFIEAGLLAIFMREDFVLAEESGADLSAAFAMEICEVGDDLLSSESSVLLFQGKCRVTLFNRDGKRVRSTIQSKVISGTDPLVMERKIIEFLMKKGARAVGEMVESPPRP